MKNTGILVTHLDYLVRQLRAIECLEQAPSKVDDLIKGLDSFCKIMNVDSKEAMEGRVKKIESLCEAKDEKARCEIVKDLPAPNKLDLDLYPFYPLFCCEEYREVLVDVLTTLAGLNVCLGHCIVTKQIVTTANEKEIPQHAAILKATLSSISYSCAELSDHLKKLKEILANSK